jgi:hypothetical protein
MTALTRSVSPSWPVHGSPVDRLAAQPCSSDRSGSSTAVTRSGVGWGDGGGGAVVGVVLLGPSPVVGLPLVPVGGWFGAVVDERGAVVGAGVAGGGGGGGAEPISMKLWVVYMRPSDAMTTPTPT